MFKYKETYLLSINNKDIGNVTIYKIINKKNSKLKKRLHFINESFRVVN